MPAKPGTARTVENARLAALERWAKVTDRTAATQAARDALRATFDPGPGIPEPQRSKMIRAAHKAHMIRMRRARADKAGKASDAPAA